MEDELFLTSKFLTLGTSICPSNAIRGGTEVRHAFAAFRAFSSSRLSLEILS